MKTPCVDNFTVVSITYRISNAAGDVVEQSDMPVTYVHGVANNMFPKVEQALIGRCVGDSVQVSLSPEEGFGPSDPGLIFVDDVANAPSEFRFVGARPVFQSATGERREMVVTKIENGRLTVDGNHPFAGQTMTFHVTVVDIRDATESEIGSGQVQPMSPGAPTLQ
jgi:FKBP-type peptidyl-prolyl cis-trans isomerase SlyD